MNCLIKYFVENGLEASFLATEMLLTVAHSILSSTGSLNSAENGMVVGYGG